MGIIISQDFILALVEGAERLRIERMRFGHLSYLKIIYNSIIKYKNHSIAQRKKRILSKKVG